MTIGEAAALSGVPAKTIRYYEQIGLVQAAARQTNNYRDYNDSDVATLRFVKHARGLGFSVEDCRGLLSLYRDRDRASADVKALARTRLAEIDGKIAELQAMRGALTELTDRCHGDARPECPILDTLSAGPPQSAVSGLFGVARKDEYP